MTGSFDKVIELMIMLSPYFRDGDIAGSGQRQGGSIHAVIVFMALGKAYPEPISIRDLKPLICGRLKMSPTAMTMIVDRLERLGLGERHLEPNRDRRRQFVRLTMRGCQLWKRSQEMLEQEDIPGESLP